MRILIVEDDPLLGDGLAASLRMRGWAVDWVSTASQAVAAEACAPFDAVVLDLGLPDGDGVALLRRWRSGTRQLPVLVLTARDAIDSRITGLDAGADDYLIKPIAADELAARLRAVLRRAKGRPQTLWRHGALCFDPQSRQATWKGGQVDLTAQETALLELLLAHPRQVLSKSQIQEKLYDWGRSADSNTIEVFIHHLRRKIHPAIVRTIRGLGYCLGDPLEDSLGDPLRGSPTHER